MSALAQGKRPKGYIHDWNPRQRTVALLSAVQGVLTEYEQYLPLTCRQIFYRLVGQYDYPKDERAYSRLCEALVKARRARVIPFSAIRDDGTTEPGASGWDSPAQWWQGELSAAKSYIRDRGAGQDVRIELWCEAAGMAPQLSRVASPYGVGVYSTGGFSSVTVTHEVAQRVLREERPTVFMHVGDYDPSGESIFDAMAEDIGAFVDDESWGEEMFQPVRIALTQDQVTEHNLPTAPPKRSDTRSANWYGETCQAEAMDPGTLANIVKDAITDRYDMDVFNDLVRVERTERNAIVSEVTEILENRA